MNFSEKFLIEELAQAALQIKKSSRGLSPGTLIKMIRTQIGMPQEVLSRRAKVPQSTISRIEQGSKDANLSTLQAIVRALDCELIIVPLLHESVDAIRKKQAKKKARSRMHYLKGTMNLEGQEPDAKFMDALLLEEEERLLKGPNSALWKDDGAL